MKDFNLLIWLTQLGLSVALPPILLIWLAVWLRRDCGWGNWVIWVAVVLSIYCAVNSLFSSVKALQQMTGEKKKDEPPVAFNEHN